MDEQIDRLVDKVWSKQSVVKYQMTKLTIVKVSTKTRLRRNDSLLQSLAYLARVGRP
jgi:hypothetical protein